MNFLLVSKILGPLLQPLGFALLCVLLGAIFRLLHSSRATISGTALIVFGLAVLYFSGTRPVAMALMRTLESGYVPVAVDELPRSAAIVVLGGGILIPKSPRLETEFNDSGDRLHYAAKLYKAGKAPRLVVAAGNVFDQSGMLSEGENSKQLLIDWGVDAAAIEVEGDSRNTYENASNTAKLLAVDEGPVLLVTSAFHMRRSVALFKAQGFEVVPASTDIQSTDSSEPAVLHWLPNSYFLHATSLAVKEYVGYMVYGWRGWL